MVADERIINVEAAVAKFVEQSTLMMAAMHEDVAEIRASNARTDRQLLEGQQRAERDRKDSNKRLAEISDSMGTLIEDMVAPCGFNLAKAIFVCRHRFPGHKTKFNQAAKRLEERKSRRASIGLL